MTVEIDKLIYALDADLTPLRQKFAQVDAEAAASAPRLRGTSPPTGCATLTQACPRSRRPASSRSGDARPREPEHDKPLSARAAGRQFGAIPRGLMAVFNARGLRMARGGSWHPSNRRAAPSRSEWKACS